ncbi:hypothetical protein BGZ59_001383 [Podila verticillata]|nr:hypothetical protein BGZ59_001383 [Podila verticillata]
MNPITMRTIDLSKHVPDVVPDRDLEEATQYMVKAKKTIVVTGAGISCSSGIPDFRSADGLYNLVKKQYPKTVLKGKDLFDANLFRDCTTTAVFYTFISELHAQTLKAKPSPTHHFIKMLSEKGKLLRCYTQNIDCLEEELGMETSLVCEKGKVKKDVNVVQLHGSLRKLKCTICSEPYGFLNDFEKVFREGEAPDCPKCELNDVIRVAQGKRKIATGTLRPDIVLYNENHPFGEAIGKIQLNDLQRSPDVLLVMGTSLKVHGLRLLVRKAAKVVHEKKGGKVILVNKTPVVGKEWSGVFDYFIEGETDRWCEIVESAIRSVKVQTKLQFKALTEEEKEQLKQKQKKEQEEQSDKENLVPVERIKAKVEAGKKRSFSAASGKPFSEEQLAESITVALGSTELGSSSASDNNNTFVLTDSSTNKDRTIASCRRRTASAPATSSVSPPSAPSSPKKQNTLTSLTKASLHVSKASVRRPVLVKPEKAMRFDNLPELRRTRSSTRVEQ